MLIHGASGGVSILKRQVIKMGFSVLVSAFFFFLLRSVISAYVYINKH